MKTLIGIVTFGNLEFTKLTIEEIWRTTLFRSGGSPLDQFVIVGKPDDHETLHWLEEQGIPHLLHHVNKGFPASLNDLWDYAWNSLQPSPGAGAPPSPAPASEGYDNVIICGNDVIPYPGAIDALIECAATTDWEWICSSQCDVHTLVRLYPEMEKYFPGASRVFTEFTARPWDVHAPVVAATAPGIEAHQFKDVQNLCLFKRSVFEKIGYFDANFWPNGYYSDNDYARRAVNAGLRGCGLPHSQYFHFWSRTIYQGPPRASAGGGRNEAFYRAKWNGGFAEEGWRVPWNGEPHLLVGRVPSRGGDAGSGDPAYIDVMLPGSLKIADREDEAAIIEYWSKL